MGSRRTSETRMGWLRVQDARGGVNGTDALFIKTIKTVSIFFQQEFRNVDF